MTELSIIHPTALVSPSPHIPSRALTVSEQETIERHLASSRSEATMRAYKIQWRSFMKWCLSKGFSPYPASPEVVCLWLSHLNNDGKKYSSISQSLAAISAIHQDNGSQAVFFSNAQVKATLRSIRRKMAGDGRSVVKKPRPFSQREIETMLGVLGKDNAAEVQAVAVLLLGVSSGLRASEIGNLNCSDITIEAEGVDILIRSSKTDQEGLGERIFIGGLAPRQSHLDLRHVLKDWLRWREGYPTDKDDDQLFLNFRKGGTTLYLKDGKPTRLASSSISRILNHTAQRAGLDTTEPKVSSHGMRHSFITTAFAKRLDAAQIAKTTRHRSLSSLLAYDQTGRKEASIAPMLWG